MSVIDQWTERHPVAAFWMLAAAVYVMVRMASEWVEWS